MKKFAVVEKKFDYKGHECICVFNQLGFRCGYVSVSENKEFHTYDIDCHCGLTFNGELSRDCEPKHKYYIGFDCGHICDKQDLEQAYKYELISKVEYDFHKAIITHIGEVGCVVRSLDYVESQCIKIVDQLEEKETEND